MKRLPDEAEKTKSWDVFKRAKRAELFEACAKEWAFFCALWPYEQLRWLYAFVGMRGAILPEVVRLVLVDWMHLQSLARHCGSSFAPLTERFYMPEHKALFAAMRQQVVLFHTNKVERERVALLQQGVPPEHLCLVAANQPYDGLGALMAYRSNFMDDHYWVRHISLPPNISYTCLNVCDTEGIRLRLPVRNLTVEKLTQFRMNVIESNSLCCIS
jgi:hypothetical protein